MENKLAEKSSKNNRLLGAVGGSLVCIGLVEEGPIHHCGIWTRIWCSWNHRHRIAGTQLSSSDQVQDLKQNKK